MTSGVKEHRRIRKAFPQKAVRNLTCDEIDKLEELGFVCPVKGGGGFFRTYLITETGLKQLRDTTT